MSLLRQLAVRSITAYDATNNLGYGASPTTGYPECIDNRTEEDQNFTEQYGILLNGNRWSIATTVNPVATTTFSGTNATYSITVADATDIKKETTLKALVFLQTPM